MSLWNLLVGICFFIAIFGSTHNSALATNGLGGRSAALLVGVVVGASCALLMSKTGELLGSRVSRMASESKRRWAFRLLYASSLVWILCSAVLGKSLTSLLLLLLFGGTR